MVITWVMLLRQRAIVRAFEQRAVTSAATARSVDHTALKPGMAWHHLVAQGVLRCPGERRCFLDVTAWQRLRRRRRHLAFAVIGALLVGLAPVLLDRARPLSAQPARRALIFPETTAMSARPAALAFTAATTLPMSRGELAPVSVMAASISASISASSSLLGK